MSFESTIKGHLPMIRRDFEGRMLSSLTSLDVERFKNDRKETPTKSHRPRSGPTVNREMATLRAMLNKGVQWGMIEKNPAALTGDRTKNGKPREIPVSQRLADELMRLRNRRRTEDVSTASDLVFQPPKERKALKQGKVHVVTGPMVDIWCAWEAAKKKAGINPGFHFHDLRHTFASHQKMAGTDDYTLMELMGHSDFKMMKRYAHLTPEHKRKAIENLPIWGSTVSEKGVSGTIG